MSEQKITNYLPTQKQKEFLNKLLLDSELSKMDYSYLINFLTSILYNHKQYKKRNS